MLVAVAPIPSSFYSPCLLAVFPMGAQVWEIAADRLDCLPGKSLIDWFVHERGMAQDGDSRCSNEPQD